MISFQFIDIPEFDLSYVEDWYQNIALNEDKTLSDFTIVLGSDDWLLEMNKEYLDHDFYTDIITFDYCEGNILSGDLLISIDRVKDNAKTFGVEFKNELNRVLVHGLLHLIGYNDSSDEEIKLMREKEEFYIKILKDY